MFYSMFIDNEWSIILILQEIFFRGRTGFDVDMKPEGHAEEQITS